MKEKTRPNVSPALSEGSVLQTIKVGFSLISFNNDKDLNYNHHYKPEI